MPSYGVLAWPRIASDTAEIAARLCLSDSRVHGHGFLWKLGTRDGGAEAGG